MIQDKRFSMGCSTTTLFLLIGFILATLTTYCDGNLQKRTKVCVSYNTSCPTCPKEGVCGQRDNAKYDAEDDDNSITCYVLWRINNGKDEVLQKGCMLNSIEMCTQTNKCIETRAVLDKFFCCCKGDMCNAEFYHKPKYSESDHKVLNGTASGTFEEIGNPPDVYRKAAQDETNKAILYSIVPIVAITIILVTIYLMWRRHQHLMGQHQQLPTMDPNLAQTPTEQTHDIQLLEHKARGRFGYVYKAKMHDRFVAVKVFPMADKKSYSAEVDIYKHSNMRHENILQYIDSQVKQDSTDIRFWLVTEYHERGSLYDYLKANTITWAQLCRIGESMTCGLAYLHDEIPATYNTGLKPAIAHRDFKSKNVLIKDDMSACIADFGLALAFDPNLGIDETHTQVGTRRYMAPEVLEGAICFNMDSFLRIDMYACSLVLWELMSRCTCVEDVVDDYRLPFEAEVGLQPSLEEMQPLVAGQKRRPAIKPAWYQSKGMASLVTTMEECWDQDADARLSAGCVHERISQLSRTMNTAGDSNSNESSSPPFYYGHQQQLLQQQESFLPRPQQHQQQQPVVNSNYNMPGLNTNQQQNIQYRLQHLQQQYQQPPPVYTPNNNNNINNSNNINNAYNINNNVNSTGNDSLSASTTVGMNVTTTSDLSSC